MCFRSVTVEFITFTFVGVTAPPHFFGTNTHAAPESFHFSEEIRDHQNLPSDEEELRASHAQHLTFIEP